MKLTTIFCDKCKKEDSTSYRYVAGKSMDISGHGYETDWKYIDLCLDCLQGFIIKNPRIKLELNN